MVIWLDQLNLKCKLATLTSSKAAVWSVSPSSDYYLILLVRFISIKFWKKYKMCLAQAKNKNTGVYVKHPV